MDKRNKKIIERDEMPKKSEIIKQNKILKGFFIIIGVILLIIIAFIIYSRLVTHFEYKGVKFNMEKYGDLVVYHTSFPVIYNGANSTYNIYLRNDPRELEKNVPAKGALLSIEDMALNISGNFNCDGDGMIAIANLVNLYTVLGKKIMRDENATCDSQGRYIFLNIREGNSTSIEGIGPNCYNININNCEILEGTERFIVGMLVKINRELSQ